MEKPKNNPLENLYDIPSIKVIMPSGFEVIIREQNGNDDDILSKYKDSQDGSSVHKFLSGIILDNSLHPGQATPPSEILNWRLKDKYYLLFKSRLFSLGSEIRFKHKFVDGTEETYEEDLKTYDWDLSKPILGKEDPNYFKYRITPFITGNEDSRTLTLSSKKVVTYNYITGMGEKLTLEKNTDDLSKNDELRARNLKLQLNSSWQIVEDFRVFNPKDMKEIRTDIAKYDRDWKCECELKNPKTGAIEIISLITSPDFFFPVELID